MNSLNHARFQQQIRFLRRQFLQDGDLPFAKVLSSASISKVVESTGLNWRERIFSPIVTLWVFLSQVLSADNSCRAAVARLNAHRVSLGASPGSAATGGYCQARKRLPERFFAAIARHTGKEIEKVVGTPWLWLQRRVLMFDGTIARSVGLKSITKCLMPLPRTAWEIGRTVSSPGNGNDATVLTTSSRSQEIKQDAIFNGN